MRDLSDVYDYARETEHDTAIEDVAASEKPEVQRAARQELRAECKNPNSGEESFACGTSQPKKLRFGLSPGTGIESSRSNLLRQQSSTSRRGK